MGTEGRFEPGDRVEYRIGVQDSSASGDRQFRAKDVIRADYVDPSEIRRQPPTKRSRTNRGRGGNSGGSGLRVLETRSGYAAPQSARGPSPNAIPLGSGRREAPSAGGGLRVIGRTASQSDPRMRDRDRNRDRDRDRERDRDRDRDRGAGREQA